MKKIYLAFVMLMSTSAYLNAQTFMDDNMESHPLGSFFSAYWSNWSLASDPELNLEISNEQAASGTKSGKIGNGDQDVLLRLLSTQTTGVITSSWNMYVPTGKFGYYNMQETNTPGESWAYECYTNLFTDSFMLADSTTMGQKMVWTSQTIDSAGDTISIIYAYAEIPLDEWFNVKQVIDLDNKTLSLYIDETTEATYYYWGEKRWPGVEQMGSFGAFNFYAADDSLMQHTFYLDDVKIAKPTGLSNVDHNSNLVKIYPNPATSYVNIHSEEEMKNISIFNVAGQEVYSLQPTKEIVDIATSNFAPGIYYVLIQLKDKMVSKEFVIK